MQTPAEAADGLKQKLYLHNKTKMHDLYVLEDSNQQVYQQDIRYQKVAGHNSRSEPGPWDAGREAFAIIIIKIVSTRS